LKSDRPFLLHILDAIAHIEEYTVEGEQALYRDRRTQDAVLRNLEVIGEAVKRLSDARKSRHPEVPWSKIAGMRDVLTHQYFRVSLPLVWAAIQQQMPTLKRVVAAEVANLPERP
jgi:uncharacterized protein with HEPN domain